VSLKEYRTKRNFGSTREPAGGSRGERAANHRFVVQKHAATRLHYDFRLEMEGVLKSWAVPKGFPIQRGDKRLAVQVEDHPLEYRSFEGIIPEGNYGAGTVMVWDEGRYDVLDGDEAQALEDGKLRLLLKGKKLKGEWTLVRMRSREDSEKPQWLLLKSGSDARPISARAEDRSALTGRSLSQIASARDAAWDSSNRQTRPPRRASSRPAPTRVKRARPLQIPSGIDLRELPEASPHFVEPMKALLVKKLPQGPDWSFEIKFDGVRALAIKRDRQVAFRSRSDNDLRSKYPPVFAALERLPMAQAVLDGEVVAVDDKGRSSFQLLQSYQSAPGRKPHLLYYVFDILNLNGRDLTGLALSQRKQIAQKVLANLDPAVRFSDSIQANSARVVREMQKRGLEGLVAKRNDSRYEPGRRSGAWAKFKWSTEQEFVIGGYTEPKGSRTNFGAILVGYYERGKLLFAAKVGTGFDQRVLASLYQRFQTLRRDTCPFTNLPEANGLTAAQMRRCLWLAPELVCQIRFSEWTRDGHLRQPAFLGLREDKSPREVTREIPR